MSGLFDDRSCVICHEQFDAGDGGRRVVHCCFTCGHTLAEHSDGLRCRTCGHECGIDCRRPSQRSRDAWPVRFPWMAAA